MGFLTLIVLMFFTYSTCSSSLLIEKAVLAANSVFKEFTTSVVWCNNKSDDVAGFIKQFHGSVVVASVKGSKASDENVRRLNRGKFFIQTVFFGADVHEAEYFLALLYQDLVIPIRLIVVLLKPTAFNELSQMMEVAWNNDVADILVVSRSNGSTEHVMLSTYFPFTDSKCDDFTPTHLNNNTTDLFPKKFINYHQCEIRITIIQMSPYSRLEFENNTLVSISGIDGKIVHIVFDILNASLKVASANYGGLGTIINGTATGSFADIVNKKADLQIPGLFMSAIRYPYAQFSHHYRTVNIIWFGPRRREISEWLRILLPFMSHITPAIFSTAIIFVVVTMTVRKFGLHRTFSRDSVVFQTFVVFLGIDVNFESKSFITNSLFILWIWFCMIVRIAYQGDLVNGLQNTVLESSIGTFEAAVKIVDGYGGIETVKDLFNGTQYNNKFTIIPQKNIPIYLKAMEAGKRFILATDKKVGLDSAPNIQILDDDPVTEGPICFGMRPGWPAALEVDKVILRMIETGFLEKVFKEHSWEWAKAVETKEDRDAKPMTLETLIGCFYGLGALYVVCTLVFFVEIVYHRIKRDQIKLS